MAKKKKMAWLTVPDLTWEYGLISSLFSPNRRRWPCPGPSSTPLWIRCYPERSAKTC